jgi:hypothetical protein
MRCAAARTCPAIPSAGAASPRPESSTPSAIDGSKGPAYGPFFYCRAWDTGLASVGYAPQIVSGRPGEHYDPVRRSGGAWCQQPSRRKRGLQITEAIRGKRILALGQWPPDRDGARDLLDLRRKGLDHYRTLELGVAQRAHDCRPREVIFTGPSCAPFVGSAGANSRRDCFSIGRVHDVSRFRDRGRRRHTSANRP